MQILQKTKLSFTSGRGLLHFFGTPGFIKVQVFEDCFLVYTIEAIYHAKTLIPR